MNDNFLAMRNNFTLLVAVSVSVFVALQIYLKVWQRPERSIIRQWIGSILLLIALIVLVDDVASYIDLLTGLNNLSWFIGYTLGTVMLFIYAYSWADDDIYIYSKQLRTVIYALAVLVVSLMTVIYMTQIVNTAVWITRTPRSVAELLFSLCFFGTGALTSIFGLRTFLSAFQRETSRVARVRLAYALLLTISTIAFFIAKVLFVTQHFYSGGHEWIDQFALQLMALVGLLFPPLLLPGKFYQWIVAHNPFTYMRHLYTLFNLRQLELYLNELLHIEKQRRFPKRYIFSNLRLTIYRTVIAILDNRKILSSIVAHDMDALLQKKGWSIQQYQRARVLHQYLVEIDLLGADGGHDVDKVALLMVRANQKIRASG